MADELALEKWFRVNQLTGFYGNLLTDRQRTMIKLYYEEDYSLGEIAEYCDISRQAVHDNINRASEALEDYEEKLQLYARSKQRLELLDKLKEAISTRDEDKEKEYLDALYEMER